MLISWKSLVWTWKECSSLLSLRTVHSSTVFSFDRMSTRFMSNCLPLM